MINQREARMSNLSSRQGRTYIWAEPILYKFLPAVEPVSLKAAGRVPSAAISWRLPMRWGGPVADARRGEPLPPFMLENIIFKIMKGVKICQVFII